MSVSLDQARIISNASLVKGRELKLKPLSVVVIDPRTSVVACLKMAAVKYANASHWVRQRPLYSLALAPVR